MSRETLAPVESFDPASLLPVANISRIMRRAIPDQCKMSREAKACVQQCVSEFIGFITSEASFRSESDRRKTITGDDVLDALRALGFGSYCVFLDIHMKNLREASKKPRGKQASQDSDSASDRAPKKRKE